MTSLGLPAPQLQVGTIFAPHKLAMGVTPIAKDEPWLDLDSDLLGDLQEKRRLTIEHRPQVWVEEPGTRPVQLEVLQLVADTLVATHPELYSPINDALHVTFLDEQVDLHALDTPPLERAAMCVQEDLVLMEERAEGWCLTAASVCFPTRWDLPSKLGRTMTDIHERVPGYYDELDKGTNRFFDRLKPGLIVRRGNWSLMDDPTLFQPEGKLRTGERPDLTADNAGEEVWIRTELQTLQRLPESGAILFTIRVHRTQLQSIANDPTMVRTLVEAIETMKADMQLYKSLAVVRAATVDYLRSCVI